MPFKRLFLWAKAYRVALLAVGLLLAWLPLLALCFYNQPFLCDFSVSTDVQTHGLWGAQPYLFLNWSGRYFTNLLLFVANPLSYGWLEGVQLTALLSQLLRIVVLYVAVRVLAGRQLRRREAALLAAGLALLYVALAPYKFSALYYFTEIVVYHVAAWLLVLVPLAVERLHRAPRAATRKAWGLAAGLGTIAAAGANELTIVLLGLVMLVGAGLSLHRREWFSLRVWVGLGVLLLVFGTLSVLAPGNSARQELDGALVPAASFGEAASRLAVLLRYLFVEPAMLVVPPLVLAFGPLAARILPARPPGLRLPLLLGAAVLVGGVVLGTVPYALMWARVPLIPRATNIMVWWWLLGWLVTAWANLPANPQQVRVASLSVRVLLGLVLSLIMLQPAARAALDLRHDAPEFARQWQQRFDKLRHAGRHTPHTTLELAPLPPLTNRLLFIPPDDVSPMCGFGVNTRLATWFGVDSVRLVVPR